jgi:hypothetical protein
VTSQREHEERPLVRGHDPKMADKLAECDGGAMVTGLPYASRQDFAGRLTGEYIDHGDPPWRWYLMTDLTLKPAAYVEDSVWCESGMIFVTGSAAGSSDRSQ